MLRESPVFPLTFSPVFFPPGMEEENKEQEEEAGKNASAPGFIKNWQPPDLVLPRKGKGPAGKMGVLLSLPLGSALFFSGAYDLLTCSASFFHAKEAAPPSRGRAFVGLGNRHWDAGALMAFRGGHLTWGGQGAYVFLAYPKHFTLTGKMETAYLHGLDEKAFRISPLFSLKRVHSLAAGDLEWKASLLCDLYPGDQKVLDFFPGFLFRYRNYGLFTVYFALEDFFSEHPVFREFPVNDGLALRAGGFCRSYRGEAGTVLENESFFFSLKSGYEWDNLPMLKEGSFFCKSDFTWNLPKLRQLGMEGGLAFSKEQKSRFFLRHYWRFPSVGSIGFWAVHIRGGNRSMFQRLLPELREDSPVLLGLGTALQFPKYLQWELNLDYVPEKQIFEGEAALIFTY